VAAPIVLGTMVGAIASGRIRVSGGLVQSGFFAPWLSLFPLLVGLFALALFAFLAATYLAWEAPSPALAGDFRLRALASGAAVGVIALFTFAASFEGAPLISAGLTGRPWTWPMHAATGAAALTAFWALYRRRFALARLAAAAQTALIVLGWGASQYPYLLVPDLTLEGAASNPRTQHLVLVALAIGSVVLFPSLYVLYRVFKGKPAGG
jgi:cytochrome d ubiquinol oxidase subunit II